MSEKTEEKKTQAPMKHQAPPKASAAPAAAPMPARKDLKPYATLAELAQNFRQVETHVQRNTLRAAWWLGYHVDQVMNHAAYGSCGMEKLAQTLFSDLSAEDAKRKTKTLYLYARFNAGYEWDDVEKRLIKNKIPLRVIERLLTIKDDKVRSAVEDALIAGKTIKQALLDTGVTKAIAAPETAEDGEGAAGEDGVVDGADGVQNTKKATTPTANKVLQALAQVEAHGGNFKGALMKLQKVLKPYETCTDAKDRSLVAAELARIMDELLIDLPDTLSETNDAIKRNQD